MPSGVRGECLTSRCFSREDFLVKSEHSQTPKVQRLPLSKQKKIYLSKQLKAFLRNAYYRKKVHVLLFFDERGTDAPTVRRGYKTFGDSCRQGTLLDPCTGDARQDGGGDVAVGFRSFFRRTHKDIAFVDEPTRSEYVPSNGTRTNAGMKDTESGPCFGRQEIQRGTCLHTSSCYRRHQQPV